MLNKVFLMGRLTRDPELRQTTSGISACRFHIAVDRQYKNQQTGERETDFIECCAWRQTAEFVSRYFSQGKLILVEGSMRNNNYTDGNGVQHYGMNVQVDAVRFCGSKQDSEPQTGTQPAAAPRPAPAESVQPKQQTIDIGELGEFEEILSDGEIPF